MYFQTAFSAEQVQKKEKATIHSSLGEVTLSLKLAHIDTVYSHQESKCIFLFHARMKPRTQGTHSKGAERGAFLF